MSKLIMTIVASAAILVVTDTYRLDKLQQIRLSNNPNQLANEMMYRAYGHPFVEVDDLLR